LADGNNIDPRSIINYPLSIIHYQFTKESIMTTLHFPSLGQLTLRAETAADLMTTNPVSIRQDATVGEAIAFLGDHGVSGAPVIDEAGRAVGVVTQSDLLIHQREGTGHLAPERLPHGHRLPEGFHVETADPCPVSDVMTPGVFSVTLQTPASRVVAEMLALKVHRLFVVEDDGTLIGVISALDILRHLSP
jgi:CBS domain-containing protein